MIAWLRPLALLALLAAAAPILIHLLRPQRATRVPFPTLRFLDESRAGAVRLRAVSDLLLLAVRIAVIAVAAAAAAQPHLWTRWQLSRVDARTTRAVIVDVSDSMQPAARRRDEAAAAERNSDPTTIEIRTKQPGASLSRAVAALRDGPVARHEIVVISDFQHGALTEADLGRVPRDFGLRFIRVAALEPQTAALTLLASGDVNVRFVGPRTLVAYAAGRGDNTRAVELFAGPVSPADRQRMIIALERSGTAAAVADRPVAILLAGASPPEVRPPQAAWMLRAIAAARQDPVLQAAAALHEPASSPPGDPWIPIAREPAGRVVVSAAADTTRLIAYVNARPSDLLPVVTLRTLLNVTAAVPNWQELESESIPEQRLRGWTRGTSPVPPERLRPESPGWARWLWGLVLVLLAVEAAVRRERAPVTDEARRAA